MFEHLLPRTVQAGTRPRRPRRRAVAMFGVAVRGCRARAAPRTAAAACPARIPQPAAAVRARHRDHRSAPSSTTSASRPRRPRLSGRSGAPLPRALRVGSCRHERAGAPRAARSRGAIRPAAPAHARGAREPAHGEPAGASGAERPAARRAARPARRAATTLRSISVTRPKSRSMRDVREHEHAEAGDRRHPRGRHGGARARGRCGAAPATGREPARRSWRWRSDSSTLNSVEIAITSAPSVTDIGFSGTRTANRISADQPVASTIGASGTSARRRSPRKAIEQHERDRREAGEQRLQAPPRVGHLRAGLGREHRQPHEAARSRPAGGCRLERIASISCCCWSSGSSGGCRTRASPCAGRR